MVLEFMVFEFFSALIPFIMLQIYRVGILGGGILRHTLNCKITPVT